MRSHLRVHFLVNTSYQFNESSRLAASPQWSLAIGGLIVGGQPRRPKERCMGPHRHRAVRSTSCGRAKCTRSPVEKHYSHDCTLACTQLVIPYFLPASGTGWYTSTIRRRRCRASKLQSAMACTPSKRALPLLQNISCGADIHRWSSPCAYKKWSAPLIS